ncbi:MAG: efflux RND transporter periplasmic adaptor subunit [Verrucomicrobium sp.]|nr:efflux RND transporter periplasmic adaptor subunit [Verrucomicrobium sp.]
MTPIPPPVPVAPPSRPARKGWVPLLLLAAAAAGIAVWIYLSRPVVEVYRAQRGTAISAVYGTVKIQWTYSVGVRTQNDGYIQLANGISSGQASIGLHVKKGQLLATIVDEDNIRSLNQAKIDLQAAQARAAVGPADEGALRTAEDTLSRLEKLESLNAVSASQLQQARNDVRRYSDAVKGEQIELDQAVQTNRQNLKTLQDKLAKTDIRAPIDGVLTAVSNNDGELVSANSVLFTVAVNSTYVSGEVNEEDVGQIHEKMKAKVRLYSFPDNQFTATVTQILPYPDPASQRYTVILSLDNPPQNLMAGMTGEMNIIIGERPNAILIPTRAVVNRDKAYVVDHGMIKRREVEMGYHSMQTTEIVRGLREGEKVIIGDQDSYHSGERVRAIEINPDLDAK